MREKLLALYIHLKSWPELYVAMPLVLLSIPGAALFAYFLTGRAPQESMTWLVDLSGRVTVAALVVVFTSFMRQASGVWMTKDEQFAHPILATVQQIVKMFCIAVFVWLFTH